MQTSLTLSWSFSSVFLLPFPSSTKEPVVVAAHLISKLVLFSWRNDQCLHAKRSERPGGKRPRNQKKYQSDGDSSSDSDDEDGGDFGRANTALKNVDDGKEWGKKVDEVQREYISTEGCRTAVSDKHFNNPPRSSQSKENKWG